MASRPTTLFSLPNAAISWKTPDAANASDASIPVFTELSTDTPIPTNTSVSTDTPVSTNAADASDASDA